MNAVKRISPFDADKFERRASIQTLGDQIRGTLSNRQLGESLIALKVVSTLKRVAIFQIGAGEFGERAVEADVIAETSRPIGESGGVVRTARAVEGDGAI